MKKHMSWVLLMLLVVSLLAFLLPGHADFGDFSGGSDFGGSDWSSSDWGSSDSDWDYSVSGSSSSDGPMDTVFTIISIVVIGVGVAGWISENFGSGSKSRSRGSGGTKTYTWGFKLRDDYSPIPGFNAESVREDCCNLYRRMQDAWGQGDLSPLQADFTPEAYAQYDRQLRQKTERGEHAHCEVRSVSAQERGWNENDHEWMLAVEITAEIRAWNENDAGKVVSGSKSAVKEMRYAWVLRRPKTETAQIQHCPNCGCEVEINAGAFCPMCGAPLTAPGAGWQLSSIQAMSQKTL